MVRRTINHFLVYSVICSFFHAMMFVTYVLFLKEHGLDYLEINLVNFAFMFCVFLFELPTGIFADLFGRKFSLLIADLVVGLSFIVYFYSTTFGGFIVAEVLCAIGVTFSSGALDAWLKDSLDHHGYKGSLTKVFTKGEIARNLSIVFGGLAGAYMGQFDLTFPWLISGIGVVFSGFYVWVFFQENYFVKQQISFKNGWQKVKEHTRISIKFSLNSRVVFFLICLDFGLLFAFQAPNMYWTLVLEKYLDSVFQIGQVWVLIPLLLLAGGYFGGYLDKFYSARKIIGLSVVVIGLGLTFASQFTELVGIVVFFGVHELGRGMINPVRRAYINNHIPSQERATILSFDSMITRLGAALGLVASGVLAKMFSIETSWLIFSLVILSLVPIVFLLPNGKK